MYVRILTLTFLFVEVWAPELLAEVARLMFLLRKRHFALLAYTIWAPIFLFNAIGWHQPRLNEGQASRHACHRGFDLSCPRLGSRSI